MPFVFPSRDREGAVFPLSSHHSLTVAARKGNMRLPRGPTSDYRAFYSHSIVAGGLLVMSYTTRLIPRTSFTIRVEIRASTAGSM
jgi:hypothetical protein